MKKDFVEKIRKILEQMFEIDEINETDDIFELGINASNIYPFVSELVRETGIEIKIEDLNQLPKINMLSNYLLSTPYDKADLANDYILLNSNTQKKGLKKIFCFPNVIALAMLYQPLAYALDEYELYSFNFIESEDRIHKYINHIKSIQPEGPYIFLGTCAGGNIAFEVTKELNKRGDIVSDIIFIDSFYYKDVPNKDTVNVEGIADLSRSFVEKLIEIFPTLRNNGMAFASGLEKKIAAYYLYLSEYVTAGQVDATLHQIEAGIRAQDVVGNILDLNVSLMSQWINATTLEYRSYQGFGTHELMLAKDYVKDNADIIRRILTHSAKTQSDEIIEVLQKFQNGYSERNLEKIPTFLEELFSIQNGLSVLGTATGEIFLGRDEVKQLINDDWKDWGDLLIDYENAVISIDGETAWFSTNGTVKYTFEHTQKRYDRYVDQIKTIAEDHGMTQKQKIALINWILSLSFHQRDHQKRVYFWPLVLSGVLVKENSNWKIIHLHFAMPKSTLPDERFENGKYYLECYNEQKSMINQKNKDNKVKGELFAFLKSFEEEFNQEEDISERLINNYFNIRDDIYVICPENKGYKGATQIKAFFNIFSHVSDLSLDIEHAITSDSGKVVCVVIMGTLKQVLTEDELIKKCLSMYGDFLGSDMPSQEKLFLVQKNVAYLLKECASGINYTCPIRLTAVILTGDDGPKFNGIHFSFPSYWIIEGKF